MRVWGGAVVVGVEADGFWSGMKNSWSSSQNFDPPTSAFQETEGFSATTKNLWDFDIAARFGLGFDQTLLYTKLGAVWGGFNFSQNITVSETGGCTASGGNCVASASGSATLPGVLLGLGAEYAILPNWTVKLEYDYEGFLQKQVNFTCSNNVNTSTSCEPFADNYGFSTTQGVTKQIVKLGLNYKFW